MQAVRALRALGFVILTFSLICLAACAYVQQVDASGSERLASNPPTRYALASLDSHVRVSGTSEIVHEHIRAVLERHGASVVSAGRVAQAREQLGLGAKPDIRELQRLGQELGVDAVVTGRITSQEISLRAIGGESGAELWTAKAGIRPPLQLRTRSTSLARVEQVAEHLSRALDEMLSQAAADRSTISPSE